MTELQVNIDFHCCGCGHAVGVTVKCEGKGLAAGRRTVAAVLVPCPTCGTINHVCFEPRGRVRAVVPAAPPRQVPEPSVN
jgi:hypothetical protein